MFGIDKICKKMSSLKVRLSPNEERRFYNTAIMLDIRERQLIPPIVLAAKNSSPAQRKKPHTQEDEDTHQNSNKIQRIH